MMTSIFGIGNMRKLSFLVFIICILISVKNQNAEIKKNSWPYSSWDSFPSIFFSPLSFMEEEEVGHSNRSLDLQISGTLSFRDVATHQLPSPSADLSETLAFSPLGVSMKEKLSVSWYQYLLYSLVIAISGILAAKIQVTAQNLKACSCILALLAGGHSIGVIHCKFFQNRLYNFSWTNKPDPSLDTGFLNLLRSRCNNNNSSKEASPSPSLSFKAGAIICTVDFL
ncbi:hypothetical protein D5086_006347 [Populus alba]|uniref:Uncharacterized protein n=1 Tax=Populus alba TaxID=43335 RepID=A0ACC4CKE5_POPAL